jgi:O-antigen/teichoic acid export membrane protein
MQYSKEQIRQALRRFLLGKAVTGLLGLAFFVLVVRRLDAEDFGIYTAMLALQGAIAVLATLGIEATLERYLPELRVLGQPALASQVLFMGIALRAATLLFFSAIAALTAAWWAPVVSLGTHLPVVYLGIAWLLLFGLLLTTCAVHEALLQQGSAQSSMALYTLVKTGMFVLILPGLVGGVGVQAVLMSEVAGTLVALVLALFLLRGHAPVISFNLRHLLHEIPAVLRGRMFRFGSRNYAAQLLMLSYGPDALRLVASSTLGLAGAARFGVVHGLYEYVQRYLPAFMLMRLIRPVFVSRYAATKDFAALNAMASLVLKINLFVLTPLLVFLLGAGSELVALLSKGRYPDAGPLLVAYVALLVPMSNQWVISIVANTTEQNSTQVKAAAAAVPGIVVGAWLATSHGLPALVVGAWVSYLLYNVAAVWMLRRAGLAYAIEWGGVAKCAVAIGVGWGLVIACASLAQSGAYVQVLIAVVASLLSVLCMLCFRLFSFKERTMVMDIVKKRRG